MTRHIDRLIWPLICRRRGYAIVLILLLAGLVAQLIEPDMLHSTVLWCALDVAIAMAAVLVIDSRARYVVWRSAQRRRL